MKVKVGQIYHGQSKVAGKAKFFVVLGTAINKTAVASFFINSNPNPGFTVGSAPLLLNQQSYRFLSWNSYLDLTQLSQKLSVNTFSIFQYKGDLTAADLSAALSIVKASATINLADKMEYGWL